MREATNKVFEEQRQNIQEQEEKMRVSQKQGWNAWKTQEQAHTHSLQKQQRNFEKNLEQVKQAHETKNQEVNANLDEHKRRQQQEIAERKRAFEATLQKPQPCLPQVPNYPIPTPINDWRFPYVAASPFPLQIKGLQREFANKFMCLRKILVQPPLLLEGR